MERSVGFSRRGALGLEFRVLTAANVLYKNPLFKNLSPRPLRDSQMQAASKLRTLGYPSFWDQVLIFCWVEVVSLWLGLLGKHRI